MRVLVVDDDRSLREALRRALVLGGYDTVSAATGQEALSQVAEAAPDALSFDELQLDPVRHGVIVGEEFVELTRTEYQLLELLMRNPRRVLQHSVIYDRVWGYDFGPASNGLRVYVGYLRRKLEEAGSRPLIHTVRGVGYVLREP